MIAMQHTDRFAILPRPINTVGAAACLKAHAAIIDGASLASSCAKHCSVTSVTYASLPGTGYRGCTSQPAAVLKSP